MKQKLVPVKDVPAGTVFARDEILDGERRLTLGLRGDDNIPAEPWVKRPELWVRSRLLGFKQFGKDGYVRVRQIADNALGYIDRNQPVTVTDLTYDQAINLLLGNHVLDPDHPLS